MGVRVPMKSSPRSPRMFPEGASALLEGSSNIPRMSPRRFPSKSLEALSKVPSKVPRRFLEALSKPLEGASTLYLLFLSAPSVAFVRVESPLLYACGGAQ